ncbi:MAG: hypothetical protein PHI12_15010 [Dehalococcoidales bacterium]|nr:hypothetical protein [Dehalococcoidales bacterium]
MLVAVYMARDPGLENGQGQSLHMFRQLVVPRLAPTIFYRTDDIGEAKDADLIVFWDMQEYCIQAGLNNVPMDKCVVWIGGMQPPEFWPGQPLPERFSLLRTAKVLVATSILAAGEISRIVGRPVHYAPHVVDRSIFYPSEGSHGVDIVAVANGIVDVQKHHYGLDRLEATGLPVRWVGEFDDGRGEKIPHDQMGDVYRNAAVFVRVTRNEGGCLSRVESLACGLPQIASDTGDAFYQVDSSNGVLLSQEQCDDPDGLRSCIDSIVGSDGSRWLEMSNNSIRLSRYYRPDIVAGRWRSILRIAQSVVVEV